MNFFKKRSKVYIFPTRMGGYLIGLIFLMFLLSTGYSNNLLLIFTLCLFTLNLLWVLESHRYISRFKVQNIKVASGHAHDLVSVQVEWDEASPIITQWKLQIEDDQQKFPLNTYTENGSISECGLTLPSRGVYAWKYLKVSTDRPFGLYRSWRYFPIQVLSFSYPRPLSSAIEARGQDNEGEISVGQKGLEGFVGLGKYEQNESMKISWKHYARSGELLVKEGEELKTPIVEIKLKLPENKELKEVYLSKMAGQLLDCQNRQIPFSLQWSKVNLTAAFHQAHLHECLKVLAQC